MDTAVREARIATQESDQIAKSDQRIARQIVAAAAATWKLPALVGAVVLIVAALALALALAALPRTTSYIARLQYTFPGVEAGRYPTGTPFTANELIDPSVLAIVYEELKLSQYNISLNDFYKGFSIRPYGSNEEAVADRFRQTLADRRLTFVERERIENQMKTQLEQASRAGSEISFTVRRRVGLPDEIGRAIVQAVPLAWSRIAIERKGAIQFPGGTTSQNVLPPSVLDMDELPVALFRIVEAGDRLDERILKLRRIPGMMTARDTEAGSSFSDVERAVRDFKVFRLNNIRGAFTRYNFGQPGDTLEALIELRIAELELSSNVAEREGEALNNTLSQFVQAVSGLRGRSGAAARGAGDAPAVGAGGTTAGAVVSEGFLDRIIDMSVRTREAELSYVSSLTNRQLEISQQAVAYRAELSKWREMLGNLKAADRPTTPVDDATRTRLVESAHRMMGELNGLWATLTRLEAEYATTRLGHTARLYSSLAVRDDVVRYEPLLNPAFVVLTFGIALAAALFLWALRAFKYYRQQF